MSMVFSIILFFVFKTLYSLKQALLKLHYQQRVDAKNFEIYCILKTISYTFGSQLMNRWSYTHFEERSCEYLVPCRAPSECHRFPLYLRKKSLIPYSSYHVSWLCIRSQLLFQTKPGNLNVGDSCYFFLNQMQGYKGTQYLRLSFTVHASVCHGCEKSSSLQTFYLWTGTFPPGDRKPGKFCSQMNQFGLACI